VGDRKSGVARIRSKENLAGGNMDPQSLPIRTEVDANERVFVEITPDQLMAMAKFGTAIEGEQLIKSYIGKWMNLLVTVDEVSCDADVGTILVYRSVWIGYWPKLTLRFLPCWNEKLERLRRKREISIIGKIKGVSEFHIELEECELL
jgi:hypothetical protein